MTSQSRKYTQLVLEIDAHLRSKWTGSRYGITNAAIAAELGSNPNAVSTALTLLTKIHGSGVTRVKGGHLEFQMPEGYPKELQDMKDSLRTDPPKRTKRSGLTSEVLDWIYDHPKQVFQIKRVADDLGGAHPTSVGNILHRFVDQGLLFSRDELGAGCFYFDPEATAVEQPGDRAQVLVPLEVHGSASGRFTYVPPEDPDAFQPIPPEQTEVTVVRPTVLQEAVTRRVAAVLGEPPKRERMTVERLGTTQAGHTVWRNVDTDTLHIIQDL